MPKHKLEKDEMYICSCGCRICAKCRNELHRPENKESSENKGHFQVNIEDKNYYCLKHGAKDYTCYCLDCNCNLCDECKKGHVNNKHDIVYFNEIKINRDYIKDLEEKAKEHKTILLDYIEITRLIFDNIINSIEGYLNSHIMIEKSLIRRYKNRQYNYQLLKNLKNKKLFENDLFDKMKKINDKLKTKEELEKKFKESNFIDNQFNSLFKEIYTPINKAKQKAEKKADQKITSNNNVLTITYNIPDKQLNRRVKLIDPAFVENNKDNILMEILSSQGSEKTCYKGPLISEYWNNRDANELKVKLSEDKNGVTDMSYMLNNCKYVTKVDFSKWKMNNITSIEAMFQLCNFSDIPNFNMSNAQKLENARALLCKCKNIKTIDNWKEFKEGLWFNVNKVEYKIKNMSMFFSGCINLEKVIFKNWKYELTQLEDISYMFNRCKSLNEVNHLSAFNSPNMKNLCGLFNGCNSLTKVSKLSFKSVNIDDLSIMFQNCTSLQTIEASFDYAKYIRDISGFFIFEGISTHL